MGSNDNRTEDDAPKTLNVAGDRDLVVAEEAVPPTATQWQPWKIHDVGERRRQSHSAQTLMCLEGASHNTGAYRGLVLQVTGTRRWLRKLDLPVTAQWRPWKSATGQVGGYFERYEGLTFATVRDAGHMVCLLQRNLDCDWHKSLIHGTASCHSTGLSKCLASCSIAI